MTMFVQWWMTRRLTHIAHEALDPCPAGTLAERRVPGAVLGEQRGHVGITVIVETEAVFRHDLADGVLLFEFGRHDVSSRRSDGAVWASRTDWVKLTP
jgi:hypothetical protein